MRRFASLGVALALAVGTLVPVAHAQSTGKTLVMGFSQEPDTFVAGEGGLYVTNVASNMVYSSLVVIDDLMRPIADLAVELGLAGIVAANTTVSRDGLITPGADELANYRGSPER